MNLLLIKAKNNIEKLQEALSKEIDSFKKEGIILKETLTEYDSIWHLSYTVKIDSIKSYPVNDFINMFKYCVSNAISEHIQKYQEPQIIKKIINQEYYYFDEGEREEIEKLTRDIISQENKTSLIINKEKINKNQIMDEILFYLNDYNEIHLDGFTTFRLKKYLINLEEIIEDAIEDYLMDREYNEFIKLLKYFVDVQESKINVIHIVIDQHHDYKMYDEENKVINNDYLKEIAKEMTDQQYLSYEDLLISTLITMAPQKIFIHKANSVSQSDLIRTIVKVFTTKVSICNGCDWCKHSNVNNNEN
ncbi:putative sporulation protein YtxC [Alkaliphilus pronyensis]|uniref:putative sporulation protein YtxC n=1 Tax=Alkaliphilus pronyensis TaxID=1482732 RepID=UPI0018656F8C|nr:putative sporulation protein YtxC [Alkaliphilus pronyensis]